jgi:hypothetical protein
MAIQSESPSGSSAFITERPHSVNILVAEDPFVSSFLRMILQRRGHKVECREPAHASAMLRERSVSADVVITNTPEAFVGFAATLPLVYTAANPDLDLAERFSHCRVLRKPFRNDELLVAVEDLAQSVVP